MRQGYGSTASVAAWDNPLRLPLAVWPARHKGNVALTLPIFFVTPILELRRLLAIWRSKQQSLLRQLTWTLDDFYNIYDICLG